MTDQIQECATGRVVRVSGSVVDVSFPADGLPSINHAIEIEWDRAGRLLVEVQMHLSPTTVRGVA